MTPAQQKRQQKLVDSVAREYGKLSEAGREEFALVSNDLLWAVAQLAQHARATAT
jgi:hypothetical protein